jgi:hypothetical protein
MPTIEVNSRDVLDAVQHLPPEEVDAVIEKPLPLRKRPSAAAFAEPFLRALVHELPAAG